MPRTDESRLARLANARLWLANAIPFLGFLVMRLQFHLVGKEHKVSTAAIRSDGALFLRRKWLDSLSEPELRGVLGHEVLHAAFLHHARGVERDKNWVVAADLAINPMLMDMAASSGRAKGLALAPGMLYIKRYAGHSAEEIYGLLGKGELLSDKGEPVSIPDNLVDDLMGPELPRGKDPVDWPSALIQAKKYHHSMKRGTLPGGLERLVQNIINPELDWRKILSAWVGENLLQPSDTYARPSRRSQGSGIYLPGKMMLDGVPDITILWDTSGSMRGTEELILGTIEGIVDDLGLKARVILCDSEIQGDFEGISSAYELIPLLKGGGGSDFTPAFTRLEAEGFHGLVIAPTDGLIGVPSTSPPCLTGCLWVVVSMHAEARPPAKWGESMKLPWETSFRKGQ